MLNLKDNTKSLIINQFNSYDSFKMEFLQVHNLTFHPNPTYKSILVYGEEIPCNKPFDILTCSIEDFLVSLDLEKIIYIELNNKKYIVKEFIDDVIGNERFFMSKFNIQRMNEPQFEEFFIKEYWYHTNQIDFKEYNESVYEFKKQRVLYNKKLKEQEEAEYKYQQYLNAKDIEYKIENKSLLSKIINKFNKKQKYSEFI